MKHSVCVSHRVPFHDCDMMHIVWHGHYYKYCELARMRFAQTLGMDWDDLKNLGFAMPIVNSRCDYRASLRYGNEFLVQAWSDDLSSAKLVLNYLLTSLDGKVVFARAQTTQVFVDATTQEICFETPEVIKNRIEASPLCALPGGTLPK